MKKKHIFIAGLALLGVSSCDDYLDVDAPSKYTEEFIFSDVSEAQTLLNGVYTSLCSDNSYGNAFINTFMLNSDVEWTTNTNEIQVAGHNEFKAFDCEADAGDLLKVWSAVYSTIEKANDFIAGAENSPILSDMSALNENDRASLLQMIGEAKCMRAMNYLDLSILMGDIPFSFTRSYDNSTNLIMPITSRDDIQKAIIDDLIEVAPQMKLSSDLNSVERCSKEFAWALIARIALYRGGYSLRHTDDPSFIGEMKRPDDWQDYYKIARAYSDSVIQAGTHTLAKNWYDVFLDECKYISSTGDDPIFEIPFTRNVSGRIGYVQGPKYEKTDYTTWGKCNGGVKLSAFHRFTYDENDVRRNAIGFWDWTEDIPAIQNSQTNYCNKWSKLWDSNHTMYYNLEDGTGINFPYMRYADVLLMFAEADNELNNGPTAEAKEALRQVRERAFRSSAAQASMVDAYINAATSKEDFFELIYDERKWEFAGEGLRWKDLVRWNLYAKVIYKTFWQFYGMASGDNSYDPDYNKYPKAVYYKRVNREDNDPEWDYSFPNQTLPQFKFWKDADYGFNNLWMNWNYIIDNYSYDEYDIAFNKVPTTGPDAWSRVDWFNWEDDALGIPVAACRLSCRGYIYFDVSDQLQPAGMPAYNSEDVLDRLPTLRYILPIPQDAITRSNGTYKNYYGY